jgi:hypothetical protein
MNQADTWHHLPSPPPNRRWLPSAIIAAGIVIAGALIGGAVLLNGHRPTTEKAATGTSGVDAAASGIGTPTCEAWATTKLALGSIPALPNGWDWVTPNIDTYIANRAAAVEPVLDAFETEVAASPPNVAKAANAYIATRRSELQAQKNHTYGPGDVSAGNAAFATLNQVCGTA